MIPTREVNQTNGNLASILLDQHILNGRNDKEAVLFKEHRLTYGDIYDQTRLFSRSLLHKGIKKADRVVILIPDVPSYISSFFAILNVGGIAVPVNPLQNAETILHIIQTTSPELIFVHESLTQKCYASFDESLIKKCIFVDDFRSIDQSDCLPDLNDFVDTSPVFCQEDEVAYILFSSGTTGKAKGIPRRHKDILICADSFGCSVLGMNQEDTVISVAKHTFGYTLGGSLLFSFLFGGKLILLPEPTSARSLLEAINYYKPSIALLQPRMISDLLKLDPKYEDFASLRLAVSAGEVLSVSLYHSWTAKVDRPLLDGFGSTEAGHIFLSNTLDHIEPGSVGKPLKHFEVKLVDPLTHQEVGEGQAGQLMIRGESLARSYWNDPVRTERSFINGSYLSDDLFSQKNGNYYILGRIDEMLKTGCGEWISPSEIETVICKLDEVQDAAVVGAHDDQGVIRLKALIVLAQRFQPSIAVKEKIIHAVENEFKELVYKRITQLEFVSHLPRGASGKLQRYLLKSKSLNDFSYDC